MAQQFETTEICTECGAPSLVQEWELVGTDGGSFVAARVNLPRCTNPMCPKADFVGWAHYAEPRPQRG